MKKFEYQVVVGYRHFEEDIVALLNQGWQLAGGIAIKECGDFVQALFRVKAEVSK